MMEMNHDDLLIFLNGLSTNMNFFSIIQVLLAACTAGAGSLRGGIA